MTPYDRLSDRFSRIATVGEASAVLHWDSSAMMPAGGGKARGDQLAVLAGIEHAMLTEASVGDDLAAAEQTPLANEWDAANLHLMRHAYLRATALPTDLVEAQARANSACEQVWRHARASSDFAAVAPYLAEVVSLTRQAAAALSPVLGLSPYDCLMDGFQRGVTAADVVPVFDRYESWMRDALPRAEAIQAGADAPIQLAGVFPAARQEGLCRSLAARAGLEASNFRLDRSTHPFCGGTPTDVRITTRYNESDPAQAVMGVLHEAGHGLYERGLPPAFARQPVGQAAGMAAHESQSLIMEMQSCRSDAFLRWLGPELHGIFGGEAAPYDPDNLRRLWRRVGRGFIRVDADEMTYPAHVIMRFRLEIALIGGNLEVADLPGAWRDGLHGLLGIVPPDDAHGCLQDIHWYDGLFGYFPSYTLGAMGAAQLMAAARREVDGLDDAIGRGDLQPLVHWLRAKVHGQGNRLGFNDLLAFATGKRLDPADFEAHLTSRYLQAPVTH